MSETAFEGLGASFYPEQQPESDWETYVRLMRDSGIKFVRMAEFAWDKFEPVEGTFDFSLFDRVLDLLEKYGIETILCTPCAAPPIWMSKKYDFFPVQPDEKVLTFGIRRHVCVNAPDYTRLSRRIVAAMADHYADRNSIRGWQVDNEIGHPVCRCPRCLRLFGEYCREKFGTVQEFNRKNGLDFWSQTLQDFDDLRWPAQLTQPSIALHYRRFHSESVIRCFGGQADLLREHGVKVPISTNYMITWAGFDHEKMSKYFDYATGDWYFGWDQFGEDVLGTGFASAYLRGIKDGIAPRFNEFRGFVSKPGEVRKHTLAAFENGAQHICYFRWDCAPSGHERDEYGVIRRAELPGRAKDEIAAVAKELESKKLPVHSPARTALLYSYDSHFHFADTHVNDPIFSAPFGNGYAVEISRQYNALLRAGETPDIVFPGGDFGKHNLLIVSSAAILTPDLAEKIRAYLRSGGKVLLLPYSFLYDENGCCFRNGAPGYLADEFGIGIVDSMMAWKGVRFESGFVSGFEPEGRLDEIFVKDAEILGKYSTGYAAMTRKNNAYCLGIFPADPAAFYREFLARVF